MVNDLKLCYRLPGKSVNCERIFTNKGDSIGVGRHYTIPGKSYIIHTFSKGKATGLI
jgi:hypothetical protein